MKLSEIRERVKGHTPGPWEHDSAKMEMTSDTRYQIAHGQLPKGINGDFGYPVADTMNRHHCVDPEEDIANGLLIASAPDLLSLAEELERERDAAREAIRWALGEVDDFRARAEGEGAYWWRKELRKRSGM